MASQEPGIEITDLVHFYERWPELRGRAVELSNQAGLSVNQRVILKWMIIIVDRVGPADLSGESHETE